MESTSQYDALRTVANKLQSDPAFMAWLLVEYKRATGMDDRQLSAALGCSRAALLELSLCRAPRLDDDGLFVSDIQLIARHAGCNSEEIARIVRTVQSISKLRSFGTGSSDQLLKAARQRPEPDLDSPEKRRP